MGNDSQKALSKSKEIFHGLVKNIDVPWEHSAWSQCYVAVKDEDVMIIDWTCRITTTKIWTWINSIRQRLYKELTHNC